MTTTFNPTPMPTTRSALAIAAPVRPRRLPAEVYRRRRVVVGVVVATFVVLVAFAVAAVIGAYFTDTADATSAAGTQEAVVAVVQPGDTLWSIAVDITSEGDVRDTVDDLVDLNGTARLTVGQRILLPAA